MALSLSEDEMDTARGGDVEEDNADSSALSVPTPSGAIAPARRARINPHELVPFLRPERGQNSSAAAALANLIEDPLSVGKPLAALCASAGMDIMELAVLAERNHIGLAKIAAVPYMHDVMLDTAIDAKATVVSCPECRGEKEVLAATVPGVLGAEGDKIQCPKCSGVGSLRRIGDWRSKKLFFDTFGLIAKNGPLVTNTNIIQNNVSFSGQQAKAVSFGQKLLEAGRVVVGVPQPAQAQVQAQTMAPAVSVAVDAEVIDE